MKKIPTLFVRDHEDMSRIIPWLNPGCEWVLQGEGVATRKYDGTCVMVTEQGRIFVRREVKGGKTTPEGFVEVGYDSVTGKRMGWEPAEQSGWFKFIEEAMTLPVALEPGTYELIGPKVNGNPEGAEGHYLQRHSWAEKLPEIDEGLKGAVLEGSLTGVFEWLGAELKKMNYEGIVWHHPDGRMAKLKKRDFK